MRGSYCEPAPAFILVRHSDPRFEKWLRSRSRLTTGDTADYQSALRCSADCQSAVSRTGSPHEPALCQWSRQPNRGPRGTIGREGL